jgi:hypothetical protein
MKKLILCLFSIGAVFLLSPNKVFAADISGVTKYTSDILNVLTILSSLFAAILIVKGGYSYITSHGQPDALESAKRTIRNSLIGLVVVIAAGTLSTILTHSFTTAVNPANTEVISLEPIEPVKPEGGLTQVMIEAISGVLQNIILSATKPLVDGIISFLTTTPSVANNSVIFNFWLVILGITDTLFAVVIALIGFHFMSASAFGFEEVDIKTVMFRIILGFLGANISIFLIDRIINLSNVLVQTVLNATGGLTQAWVLNAFDPGNLSNPGTLVNGTELITLIFMLLFVILTVVLLFYYIGRLIVISLGAVLSPLIFLLWTLPWGADFAKIAIKTYLITIFTVFVHVVTIQVASSFLSVSQQSGTNSLISVLVGVGVFFTLLKIPGMLINMAFYSGANQAMRKVSSQVMNVISSSKEQVSAPAQSPANEGVKTRARRVAI